MKKHNYPARQGRHMRRSRPAEFQAEKTASRLAGRKKAGETPDPLPVRRRSPKVQGRMCSPRGPVAPVLPSAPPLQPSAFIPQPSSYDLPGCVILWASVMVGASTRSRREAAPHIARHMLKSALAYRAL